VTRRFTTEERRARLARRHRLLPSLRTDDLVAVADSVVALHSTDPVSVYLSSAARLAHPSIEAVERALYDDRVLVRHHAMRRTLWIARPEAVRWMHAACTRKQAAVEHRRTVKYLTDAGRDDAEDWIAGARKQVLDLLHTRGPMSTRDIGEALPELRVPLSLAPGKSYAATISAHTRIPLLLGFEGEVVRTRPLGTWVSGAYLWAAMDTWMPGGVGNLTEEEGSVPLADAYLRRFGPVTQRDLQWWAGWTVTVTKRALAGCGAEQVELENGPGWVAAGDAESADDEPVPSWVALLPSLDPTTMGWKDRAWYLDPRCADAFDSVGNAGATIWADGRVVGTWAMGEDGGFRAHYFLDVPDSTRAAVEVEAERLRAWVGETRFSVRFPGHVQKALSR
jgi:hypothetical protein